MAKNLKSKLSKLRYEGNITDSEYKILKTKLNEDSVAIWNNAIDEFVNRFQKEIQKSILETSDCGTQCKECLNFLIKKEIEEIAKQIKK